MSSTHLPLWYMGKVPAAVCDEALQELLQIEPQEAAMGQDGAHKDTSQRDTVLRFAPTGHWFGGVLYEHGLAANNACGWGYNISHHENLQLGSYGAEGHYNWHTDTFPLSGAEYERKVSVICLLSDPSEYTGGSLQLRLYQEYDAPLQKGDLIAFPSMIEHRVVPVLSGVRTSAVIWLNGPRMR